jgi:ABC-type multidrug transport system ATPase subunit
MRAEPPSRRAPRRQGLLARFRGWLLDRLFGPEEEFEYASPQTIQVENPDEVKRASLAYDEQLEYEFHRRIAEPVRLTSLRLSSVNFFGDSRWDLNPRVNVLLGANGYGKSLILRTLAGLLQHRENETAYLVTSAPPSAEIVVELTRSDREERIARDQQIFLTDSGPKVPLLAIPDSRFTDRSTTVGADPNTESLALEGAIPFLEQRPYQSTVDGLLAGLALDYWRAGDRFTAPSFALLEDVLGRLTDREFAFHSVRPLGRTGSEIMVMTEGLDRPLPIKQASQGTLSVVAIFGLIQAFLHDVAQEGGIESEPETIVIIDEVDAHLHPSWQQRIRGLLTEYFPTVQFILSSHSPLVVAGCGEGEVAVLRRGMTRGSFVIDQVRGDFLGATSPELYEQLFEIEDRDAEFKRYANRGERGVGDDIERRLQQLYAKRDKGGLNAKDADEMARLVNEAHTIARVTKIVEAEEQPKRDRLDLEVQVAQLQRRIEELESELDRPEVE